MNWAITVKLTYMRLTGQTDIQTDKPRDKSYEEDSQIDITINRQTQGQFELGHNCKTILHATKT